MQKASSKAFEVFSPTCGPLSTNFLFSFSIDTPIYPIFYHWQNTKDICTVIFLPTLCTYYILEMRVFSQRVKIYWSRQFDDQGKSPNFNFNFIKGFLKLWRENDNEVGLFCPNCLFFYQLPGRLRPMIDLWPFYSPKCKAIMQNAPPFMSHGNWNLHLGCLTWNVQKKWAKIHFKGMKNCFFPWTQINFYIFSPLQMSSYKALPQNEISYFFTSSDDFYSRY